MSNSKSTSKKNISASSSKISSPVPVFPHPSTSVSQTSYQLPTHGTHLSLSLFSFPFFFLHTPTYLSPSFLSLFFLHPSKLHQAIPLPNSPSLLPIYGACHRTTVKSEGAAAAEAACWPAVWVSSPLASSIPSVSAPALRRRGCSPPVPPISPTS